MPPQIIPVVAYTRDMIGNLYTSNGASDLGGTSSVMFKVAVSTAKWRVLYVNYQGTSGGEQTTGLSSLTVQGSYQSTGDTGTPVAFTFGGNASVVLQPGQQIYSDWITTALPAGRFITIRTFHTVPSGGAFPTGPYVSSGSNAITGYTGTTGANNYAQNQGIAANANGSNQLLTAGAASAWFSTSGAYNYGPVSIDGYATDGVLRPIIALSGDSITQGSQDSPDMCGGAAVRAMLALGVPYYNLAKGGETCNAVYTGNGYGQRYTRAKAASAIIEQYGTNDLVAGNVSFATIRSQKLLLWQYLAQQGQLIIPVTLLPRVSYSGNVYPVSQQTAAAGNVNYQAYNAWLRAPASAGAGASAMYDAAQLGVVIPGIVDAASYVETNASNATPGGPSAPLTGGLWWCGSANATAYTADGTHPNSAGALLMVPAFTGAQSLIVASTPPSPIPSGTKSPGGTKIADALAGSPVVIIPWAIPATGTPESTGVAQSGSTTYTISGVYPAGTDLANLMDRMVRTGQAVIT